MKAKYVFENGRYILCVRDELYKVYSVEEFREIFPDKNNDSGVVEVPFTINGWYRMMQYQTDGFLKKWRTNLVVKCYIIGFDRNIYLSQEEFLKIYNDKETLLYDTNRLPQNTLLIPELKVDFSVYSQPSYRLLRGPYLRKYGACFVDLDEEDYYWRDVLFRGDRYYIDVFRYTRADKHFIVVDKDFMGDITAYVPKRYIDDMVVKADIVKKAIGKNIIIYSLERLYNTYKEKQL